MVITIMVVVCECTHSDVHLVGICSITVDICKESVTIVVVVVVLNVKCPFRTWGCFCRVEIVSTLNGNLCSVNGCNIGYEILSNHNNKEKGQKSEKRLHVDFAFCVFL